MERNIVKNYRSKSYVNNAPKPPQADQLNAGEIAVNYNNTQPCVFFKTENGTIIKINGTDYILDEVNGTISVLSGSVEAIETALGGHTIKENVPSGAKFTDTVYDDTALSNRVSTIEGKESGWDAKYSKPLSGIPKSDLASSVQTSLGKADSALQSHQSLSNYYTKSEAKTLVDNEAASRESAVSAEATARSQADTNLSNTKENKLNTASGFSSSNNIVLVSIGGNIQWKPFNNILAGSTTPMSSEGNNGDIYIQTQ